MGDRGWASDAEVLQYQRMTAQLYSAGAVVAFAVGLLPHWRGTSTAGVIGDGSAMAAVAVFLHSRKRALPRRVVQLMPVPGLIVITAGVFAVGPQGAGATAAFYTMLAMGAFTFLKPRFGVLYLVTAALAYGALLVHWHVHGWPAQVLVMFSTSLIASSTAGRLMRRIRVLAWEDELTGLANRRAWYAHLERELEHARRRALRLSVAVIDLDHFKRVNDTEGHEAGDRLLRDIADRWRNTLPANAYLARWGGDEFAVVFDGSEETEASAAVEQLRAAMPAGHSFSAGVAAWNGNENGDELVVRADQAVYNAKQLGRARTTVRHAS